MYHFITYFQGTSVTLNLLHLCALTAALVLPGLAQAKDLPIPLKVGQAYEQGRAALLRAGWRPVTAHTSPAGRALCYRIVDENLQGAEAALAAREPECQYEEIQSCSGTGMGYCNMQFHDGNGSTLAVVTTEGPPPGAIVNRWKQEARKPTPVATGQAAKLSKQQCERFLGAGMYNSVLEQLCDFNGGVAQKILSVYDAGACRATVPQSVVDKTSKEVLSDTQKRYEVMGKAAFCEGNWSAYHELMKAQ